MNAKELQKLYKSYKEAELISDELSNMVMENLENVDKDLEALWDEAYKSYWRLREELVQAMMKLLKIERQTVNRMLTTDRFNELMNMKII